MQTRVRPVESLRPADFLENRIWEFVSTDAPDETHVRPVQERLVDSLDNRIIGVEVQLANGRKVWGVLGNVDVNDIRRTRQFLTLSAFVQESWFHLARYQDLDRAKRGPARLAKGLGLPIDAVFPIHYDITSWVTAAPGACRGSIETEPPERLTRAEWIRLAVR
jgi:hypothetical protein